MHFNYENSKQKFIPTPLTSASSGMIHRLHQKRQPNNIPGVIHLMDLEGTLYYLLNEHYFVDLPLTLEKCPFCYGLTLLPGSLFRLYVSLESILQCLLYLYICIYLYIKLIETCIFFLTDLTKLMAFRISPKCFYLVN